MRQYSQHLQADNTPLGMLWRCQAYFGSYPSGTSTCVVNVLWLSHPWSCQFQCARATQDRGCARCRLCSLRARVVLSTVWVSWAAVYALCVNSTNVLQFEELTKYASLAVCNAMTAEHWKRKSPLKSCAILRARVCNEHLRINNSADFGDFRISRRTTVVLYWFLTLHDAGPDDVVSFAWFFVYCLFILSFVTMWLQQNNIFVIRYMSSACERLC